MAFPAGYQDLTPRQKFINLLVCCAGFPSTATFNSIGGHTKNLKRDEQTLEIFVNTWNNEDSNPSAELITALERLYACTKRNLIDPNSGFLEPAQNIELTEVERNFLRSKLMHHISNPKDLSDTIEYVNDVASGVQATYMDLVLTGQKKIKDESIPGSPDKNIGEEEALIKQAAEKIGTLGGIEKLPTKDFSAWNMARALGISAIGVMTLATASIANAFGFQGFARNLYSKLCKRAANLSADIVYGKGNAQTFLSAIRDLNVPAKSNAASTLRKMNFPIDTDLLIIQSKSIKGEGISRGALGKVFDAIKTKLSEADIIPLKKEPENNAPSERFAEKSRTNGTSRSPLLGFSPQQQAASNARIAALKAERKERANNSTTNDRESTSSRFRTRNDS